MRHNAFYLGIVAVLVASCSVQEKNFIDPDGDQVVIEATFEQPAEEGTRVYVNEDLFLRWNADDRISLFQQCTFNRELKCIGETGDSEAKFDFVGPDQGGSVIPDIVSVYPYQASTSISLDEVLTLTLPAEQSYAPSSFGLGANTAVSVTSDGFLLFKNVCGYLKISLYGEGVSVSSITLTGNKGEKIAGTASVTMPLGGLPSVELASDATTSITLTCAEPVALGATAAESVDFWFVVPPVTFSEGFTVSVTHAGGVFEKSTEKSVAITRNHLSSMAPVEIGAAAPQSNVFRITHMWLWGGTGGQYGGTKVLDLLTLPDYFNKEDGRGVTALSDNYYELRPDGTFVNYAGEDGRNWWFVYSGSKNPENGKDLDLRKFYDVLPLAQGQYAIDGATVTFTKPDNTTTQATFVAPGTYDMPDTSPLKSVTIGTQALMFTISGGVESWDQSIMYTDYHAIAGNPKVLFVEMEQMPAGFVVPEASKTTDADFEYKPDFSLADLPGKWNVYGGNKAPFGIWVLGGSGSDPAFVSPIDKSWDWNDSIWWESDNGLTITATSMTATEVKGTTNWWSGADGKFWDYVWKKTGEDLSRFYDKIPKGEKEFTLDLATMTATFGNGEQAKLLTPGTHSFAYGKSKEIPTGCFGLAFHLMDPIPATADHYNDVDRFVNAPLEYLIIFEKVE